MQQRLEAAAARVRQVIVAATQGMVNRESLAELILLAAVAGEHLLVIGPPGTAKSATVRRVAQSIGGRYFEYLLGRFTEPAELFGPIDLRRLREGVVETDVSGMLPEAEVAFLDEVFLGSTAILNTLLGLLNERRFRRGHTDLRCPLRVCVGAANSLPDDESLAAFADRFLLHHFLDSVADSDLEALLEGGWQIEQALPTHCADVADLDFLAESVRAVALEPARAKLAEAVRVLRKDGLRLSDRRIVKAQRLVAAAAVLAGRTTAGPQDLWPLFYVMPTQDAQAGARDALAALLDVSANPTLRAATELAARQPLSRVARLQDNARAILAETPPVAAVEAVLREIDANFASDQLPEALVELRGHLMARIKALESSADE